MTANMPAVRRVCALAVSAWIACAGAAMAQSLQDMMRQNQSFDARQNAQLQQMMAANNARMQETQQSYMREFGPMLRQQYVATGANQRMSFEQYAYWMMMTANGTNIQGGLDAQHRRFNGIQDAHRTVTGAYSGYNDTMRQNSERQTNAVENWTRGAINGQAQFVNPQTGAPVWMPYYAPGQAQSLGGNTYVQGQNGTYWQQQNNGWVEVQPWGR